MSSPPDGSGVAALVAELDVRRHLRVALVTAVGFSLAVFVLFAYLPGTAYPLPYWGALSFVLAFAVFVLVATALVARAAYRRTLAETGGERRRSPYAAAVVVGAVGWVGVEVALATGTVPPRPVAVLVAALVSTSFLAAALAAVGLWVVVSLSLSHRWRPAPGALGAGIYTTVVVGPAAPCAVGSACPGSPVGLALLVATGDPGVVPAGYATAVIVAGLAIGGSLVTLDAAPPHGFLAGAVAGLAALPVVAASAGDPGLLRTGGPTLPLALGVVGAVGGAATVSLRQWHTGGRG